jgi:arylsulfatase A-like enzyme
VNLVLLVSDTFRWDYLGAYGNTWIHTPNLDRLAAESVRYTRAFGEGLPTIQARRVITTGRPIVPCRYRPQAGDAVQMHGWHPLYDEDVTAAEHLKKNGFVTCMVTDVYHMMKPGKNFHRGFDCWHWIRDRKRVADIAAKLPESANPDRVGWIVQHLVNRAKWQSDADTSAAQVMRRAADWIRDYTLEKPFFMYVDCFDPHEPWDPPLADGQRYKADFNPFHGILPAWEAAGLSDEEFANARAAYAGEVTLVDRWVGRVLEALKETGRYDDTLILFTSDHGSMMGEQGEIHKREDRLRNQVTQLPLLVRHPKGDGAGRQVDAFVQHQDLVPTALGILGIEPHERMTGANVWPIGNTPPDREAIVTAFGHFACVRTKKWNYVTPWTQLPEYRQVRHELYDLEADPEELTNVLDKHPDVARGLRERLTAHIKDMAPLTDGRFQSAAPGSGRLSFDCVPLAGADRDSSKV